MGVNSHILPGDLVVVHDANTQLYDRHPDLIATCVNLWPDDDRLVGQLLVDEVCLVVAIASAGSANGGHAFLVMASQAFKMGWVCNYRVRPHVTQRDVDVFQGKGPVLDITSYESWANLFSRASSSSRGSGGK